MEHSLSNLRRPASQKRRKKRLGRGSASGKGNYSARGMKGQTARSGGTRGLARRSAFQQLLIRTPKLRGFKRASPSIAIVNLSVLNEHFKDGETVTQKSLVSRGLISRSAAVGGVKVLANGTLEKKLTVQVSFASKTARAAIQKAGGTCAAAK
ncbi:50S ribosomal protein L15 [bacterium CG10_46_32]|nr:MAG: 50S ribosomal protein L15 [bacterium CG10_46_32]PIR56395.1 MAG: 50S ribosomal protein L15 [Parcubacteria group bacterium CG10_big_fil_rev_8_21_14_0_10_46_32]